MTAPASQRDQQDQYRDAVIAALAVWLGSPAALGAVFLPAKLAARLVALGLSSQAVRRAGQLGLSLGLPGRGPYGSPTVEPGGGPIGPSDLPGASGPSPGATTTVRRVKADEPNMRARYIVAAAQRLTRAKTLGVFPEADRLEPGYTEAQRDAARNRIRAATALDKVAAHAGPWLVWQTRHDDRVEAECAALDGRVFTLDDLPGGQLPGAVHPRCRCYAISLSAHGKRST